MPEPPTLILMGSLALAFPVLQWYIGHPRCKSCGTRVRKIDERNGDVVAECPRGCHISQTPEKPA